MRSFSTARILPGDGVYGIEWVGVVGMWEGGISYGRSPRQLNSPASHQTVGVMSGFGLLIGAIIAVRITMNCDPNDLYVLQLERPKGCVD